MFRPYGKLWLHWVRRRWLKVVLTDMFFVLLSKLEAIQRWLAICRVWPWTLTYQKFLLCISSHGQDLYSHQKLNMYIYWFSSESGYRRRRRRRQRQTPQYKTRATYRQLMIMIMIMVMMMMMMMSLSGSDEDQQGDWVALAWPLKAFIDL